MSGDSDSLVKALGPLMALAQLAEHPDHGYQLVKRLQNIGVTDMRPGVLYPIIRSLEGKGLVSARWETESGGSPRKVLEVTNPGRLYLSADIQKARRAFEIFESACGGFE